MVSQIDLNHSHLHGQELTSLFGRFIASVCEEVNCPDHNRLADITLAVDPIVTTAGLRVEDVYNDGRYIQPNLLLRDCELQREFSPTHLTNLSPDHLQEYMDDDLSSTVCQSVDTSHRARCHSITDEYPASQTGEFHMDERCEPTQLSNSHRKKRNQPSGIADSYKKQKTSDSSCESRMQCKAGSRRSGVQDATKHKRSAHNCTHIPESPVEHPFFEKSSPAAGVGSSLSWEIQSLIEGIENAQWLIELKRLIQQGRQPTLARARVADNASICQRFSRIKSRQVGVLYLVLQQWIDILLLYEDCAQAHPERKSQFAIEAPRPSTRSLAKVRGNPLVKAESAITDDILRQLQPEIQHGSRVWDRERKSIKEVCRMGRRFALLKAKFGEGILCLILTASVKIRSISATGDHMCVIYIRLSSFADPFLAYRR